MKGLADLPFLTSDLLISDESMELSEQPESLIIIGGGYIALELGQFFRRLGTQVTMLEQSKQILPNYEPEVGDTLAQILRDDDKKGPLFRSVGKGNRLGERALSRFDVLHMIKRRAAAAALPYSTCCHTFRATGITTYLENGGTLEHARTIANHESPRTTKLYDRTREQLTADEIERIRI